MANKTKAQLTRENEGLRARVKKLEAIQRKDDATNAGLLGDLNKAKDLLVKTRDALDSKDMIMDKVSSAVGGDGSVSLPFEVERYMNRKETEFRALEELSDTYRAEMRGRQELLDKTTRHLEREAAEHSRTIIQLNKYKTLAHAACAVVVGVE